MSAKGKLKTVLRTDFKRERSARERSLTLFRAVLHKACPKILCGAESAFNSLKLFFNYCIAINIFVWRI